MSQTVVEKLDPRGRKYYWIAGTPDWEQESGTDYDALLSGYVSVTPLHLDLTDYRGLESTALRDRLEHLQVGPRQVGSRQAGRRQVEPREGAGR